MPGEGSILSNVEPGQRAKEAIGIASEDAKRTKDMLSSPSELVSSLELPNEPGPAVAGRTPIVGTVRRENGVTVLRDKLGDKLDS